MLSSEVSQCRVRQRLLDSARASFLEAGYKKATNRLIAARASTNSAMIAYYFETKNQLFEEVIKQETLPLFDIMLEISKRDPDITKVKQAFAIYLSDKDRARLRAKLLRDTLLDDSSAAHNYLINSLIKHNAQNFLSVMEKRGRQKKSCRIQSLTDTWLPIFSSLFFGMLMPDLIDNIQGPDKWIESSIRIISFYTD